METRRKQILSIGIRLALAAVFIYAGVPKILNPAGFAENINNYRLFPYFLVSATALILPWLEVVIGIALISGIYLRGSSLLVMVLNGVFIVLIASAMLRGLDIDCGCFSTSGNGAQVGFLRIFEDLIFFAGGFWIYTQSREDKTAPEPAQDAAI